MDIKQFHSELDSMRFGYNVAKINTFDYPITELLTALRLNNYKLVLSKVNVNNIPLINKLEQAGFLLKDIQLTYEYELNEIFTLPSTKDIKIRFAQLSDKEELYQLAINSFVNYGHYCADEKLDKTQCQEIYGDWIVRSYDPHVADNIIVAEVNGEIAGFLSHKIYDNKQFRYAAGGIGAVASQHRNKDIFKIITITGINWAFEKNCQWVEHNVLITNLSVIRSFEKLGFKPTNSMITFHKWLDSELF